MTSDKAEDAINRMFDKELNDLVRRIKKHDEPPRDDNDIYWQRYPWYKFGGVGGFVMQWNWFRDDVILINATKEDIMVALSEIEKEDNNNDD